MYDRSVSTSKLITGVLWGWVAALFLAAWVTWWYESTGDLWMMLAFTGCASSALAATSQIRCYSLRICGLLRATGQLEDAPSLRSLR